MSEATPKNVVRIALLSIWGVITLVLVFTVSVLFYQMYQQGQNPLNFDEDTSPATIRPSSTPTPLAPKETVEVALYFASPTSTTLIAHPQHLELTENTLENCRQALLSLIAGPANATASPILSPKTRIRAMYLRENNELVVDFSRELEAGHINSATADRLMVHGITKTLSQPALRAKNDRIVQSIRFLFEGSSYQGAFPSHYDLSAPISLEPYQTQGDSLDAQ